jgi:exosortase/archaeosortase family protein
LQILVISYKDIDDAEGPAGHDRTLYILTYLIFSQGDEVPKRKGRKLTKKGKSKASAKSMREKRARKKKRLDVSSLKQNKEKIKSYIQIFVALMIGVEGLDLTVTANKLVSVYPFMWGVGLLMVIGGFTWALYLIRPGLFEPKDEKPEAKGPRPEPRRALTIAERVMSRLTLRGRLTRYLPVLGVLLIILDLFYNWYYYASISYDQLGTHDIVTLLFAGVLIAYPMIPTEWEKERDFAFFFSVALIFFLIIPLLLIRGYSHSQEGAVDQYAARLLAKPLVGLLNAIGVEAYASGIYVEFAVSDGTLATLGITTSCSGIYSFTIFSAAFVSFVMVEYHNVKAKVVGLMALGIFTAYLANLLRMLIITMVGHWFDTADTDLHYTLWAHANAGWLIFLIWIALFWWLMFRYMIKGEGSEGDGFEMVDLTDEIFCVNCGLQIDNDNIPLECPECGQVFEIEAEEE